MRNQDKLRQKVKIAKAISDWSYKDMSEVIEVSTNAFYNWLNGAYQFSRNKEVALIDLINSLLE